MLETQHSTAEVMASGSELQRYKSIRPSDARRVAAGALSILNRHKYDVVNLPESLLCTRGTSYAEDRTRD